LSIVYLFAISSETVGLPTMTHYDISKWPTKDVCSFFYLDPATESSLEN